MPVPIGKAYAIKIIKELLYKSRLSETSCSELSRLFIINGGVVIQVGILWVWAYSI